MLASKDNTQHFRKQLSITLAITYFCCCLHSGSSHGKDLRTGMETCSQNGLCSAQYQVLLVLFSVHSSAFDTVKHVRFDCREQLLLDFCRFRVKNVQPNSLH